MAIENSRFKTRKEREEEKKRKSQEERFVLPTYEELNAIEEKAKEDAARVASSEKGLDFFQRPSNWDDGYQFGDVTKTALGTLGDVGVNAVKGVVRMGEGIGDAAQYGAAALADLFGADEKAEAIRQNAQRDKVTEAFSGVDEKLNKYSVLGRTSDAAAESLGQIGAVIGTAGLAGALGAGAVGTTAATTGLMGLSSFGSGTGEAYAAGAEEGEAEAYGAIAGAADALSEMIFGGLGKGFKALGLSKGITSADDLLAKAVTSKIRNTLAKNTVQLGIKAGAEGLEEVLAGTMQAAGKKATYMSERDFADIIKDENLLEQFVVGAMASGITQTPSLVSATRAGVDLVSDGADAASDSAQDEHDKFSELRGKNEDFGEIERTGLASGAKDEDIRMAGELSTVLGKKIRFFSEDAKNGTINNGEYHEDTGEIWINTRSKNVKTQIVAHELTHSIEKNDGYRQLVDLTMNKLEAEQKAKGKTLDDLYREKETLYADGGVRLASYDEITSELVAEFVEKRLLTDEASIKSLVSENRTLGQRIREWFDSLLVKMGNASAKEREYIRQMRDMYARALDGETENNLKTEGVKHSFVGVNAEIDKSKLAVAERMEAEGKSKEDIRQKTGWFRSYDNKWRYEIDDSQAVWHLDTAEPDRKRLFAFGEKSYKLGDILEHDALYEAYPQLRDVEVYESPYASVDGYVVGRSTRAIALKKIDDRSMTKDMLLHELQHILQNIEGFATGASAAEYSDIPWGEKEWTALEKRNEAARKLYAVLRRHGESIPKSEIENNQVYGYLDPNDSIISEHYLKLSTLADQNKRTKEIWDEYWEQVRILNRTTPQGQYHATAGEIEAYDTQARRRMTADERKAMRPNIDRDDAIVKFSLSASEIDGSPIDTERISSEEGDVRYSITYAPQIEESQKEYIDKHKNVNVTDQELEEAHRVTEAMVDVMMKYSDILPEDKIGKVLTKNGSYDRSVENTTICVRTLAYNEFVDRVQAQIGRPLTQMESFLVSQKLYDIATDPQCMYCYVSLDRKSYNEMLLRYMQDRDTVIDKYNKSDKTPAAVESLYEEFLAGRKDTKNMRDRFNKWISYADNGTKLLSMADIATEARQTEIRAKGDQLADQLKDARAYAQSASWSKIQKDYVAYRDEILKLGDRVVKDLNEHYGMRWYSFSDYSAAFIVENMQQITDAAIRGLKGLSYTKDTDFAKIFAPSGMNINISVFVKQDKNGNYYIDDRQSADFEEALALRKEYPNVGIVATVTDDGALRWAGEQEWSDVIIPFHIVRTGTDVASFYKWLNYTAESGDTIKDQNLWEAYVDSLNPKTEAARKKVSKNIYPSEHHNDKETYLNLCESRGLTPRFARFAGEDWYMKLVNETRRSADETPAMKPVFNEAAAKESFAKFVDKGGYSGGWYREGVDVDAEAKAVAEDVLAGKKADEVSYGRQDVDAESLMARRKSERSHGVKHSVSREDASVTEAETDQTLQQIRNDIAADEARYRELSDTVMSNERFNALMPDEQNAILDEMQSLRERIDRANQIMQDMSNEQDMGDDVPVPGDENTPAEDDGYHGMKSMRDAGDDIPMPGDEYAPPQRRPAQAEFGEPETVEVDAEEEPKLTRKVLHKNIMDRIKERFAERGFDFDKVLAKAKDLSTFATVDNTPQRVMEKSLGYKGGRELSDMTIDQAAKNETEAIRWLNGFTDKKDGVLAKLSKKYNIKPGSKESAAAQMYAEGFYVSDKNEIVEYGDRELAADFPDAQVRENIKGLAHDPIIRQIYDETLDAINASRTRNAFPEIQKLDNYYLHFRAMDDTFSRLGIPFNPNDIRAKDLPTDLNGVTADLKPGQPYFASANHRLGKRTSFDLLGGMEKYLTSAKNQIYHIDDIQTLRALRNYVADMYGQAEGLSNLDDLSDEEAEARIKDVYGSHLSTFAKFLNEEANVLAGKTSLIDRGLEGVIGRRGITFLNDVNRQVGANMVGYNISSSLTNFLAPVQAFAKMNKAAFVKGFAQTVENRMKSITGNGDDFAQKSDVIVRRKGADRFHRTAWQKMSDPGYLLMGMVDDISTEIIARAKYNELTAKGMDAETANRETDKWVSRLMGDRSLGQMPQIFNSKMLGLVTKFQLEVRNQLDSQFYDTIKEAQVQYEEIGDKAKRNAKTAAKVAATFAELALAQHVFGSVFESIAGYNPAFDIIEVIATVLGLDDDEESEDTALDNIEQGVLALIEDLPYSSVIMDGGRIPVSSAMPIGEIIKGQDEYGNDINRLKTVAEAVPYYALPGGYGQIKKTAKGLSMFSGDKEVTGSYTDSGNLRFPVEATPGNIAQAAVFGQWANENARDYFDNERKPANERQTIGYAESGLEWKEFQRYRDQISKLDRDADKLALIKSLDIDQTAKEALYRHLVASAKKDDAGNIIGSSEDERLAALYATGLRFSDYADAKLKQAELNADEGLTANQRATRFYAWAASEGYTDEQADAITEQFKFSSGFKVEPTQYKKLIGGGVSPEIAVLVTDALSGASRAIDKINAVWSTGLTGKQLDNAVKAVVTEGWYERYRKVVDANVPLDVLTWVLDNADANGNDSIDNEERTLILSQLALSRKELSALWEATGGSEKSNPYSGNGGNKSGGIGVKIEMPKVEMPKIKMPKIELPKIGG